MTNMEKEIQTLLGMIDEETLLEMIDEATTVEQKEYYQLRTYRLKKFMNQLMGNY